LPSRKERGLELLRVRVEIMGLIIIRTG
jgi:hypothetical protein